MTPILLIAIVCIGVGIVFGVLVVLVGILSGYNS